MAKAKRTDDDFLAQAAKLRAVRDQAPGAFLAAAKSMGIEKRKAYYLVDIHDAFHGLPVDRERLLKIKWTKLKVLAPHVTEENLDELLSMAESLSTHLLEDAVSGEIPAGKKRCVLLYLSEDEYDLLAKVLKSHGASEIGRGLQKKEEALVQALKKLVS